MLKTLLTLLLFTLTEIFTPIFAEIPDSVKIKLNSLDGEEQVKYLIDLSWKLREKDTENALLYGKRAIQLSDSLNLRKEFGIANNNVGVILIHYMYQTKEAVPYFHNAMEIALQNKDSLRIGYSYNNLGDVYYLTGNAPLALEYAKISMDYMKAINDSMAIAYGHINFGLVYSYENQLKLAEEHFLEAIKIRRMIGFTLGLASAQHQLADVYYKMGNFDHALDHYQTAFEFNKKVDNKKWMAFSLNGIGKIHYDRSQYDSALVYFNKALELNKERDHTYGIIENRLGRALVFSKLGNRVVGEAELEEASRLAKELGVSIKLLQVYETIAKFYLNINDFRSATESFNSFLAIYDSLYSAQQYETLAELQNSFGVKQQLREREQELAFEKTQTIYLIIISGLLAFLIAVIFWRYRSYKSLTKKLKESNEAKDKLFSILAHDLRNPFFMLMGYIDLLKDEAITGEERNEIIHNLETGTKSTYSLLENLLSLSASKRGQIEFSPVNLDASLIISRVIDLLRPQFAKKSITIKSDVEEVRVKADEKMLETVIRNLLSNAIKYSKSGSTITVDYSVNKDFCFSVTDEGIGMDESTLNKIFRSEFLPSKRGTSGEKGTGIGLSLCKEFVEKHNGTIEAASELGKGSKFTVCLPQSK